MKNKYEDNGIHKGAYIPKPAPLRPTAKEPIKGLGSNATLALPKDQGDFDDL